MKTTLLWPIPIALSLFVATTGFSSNKQAGSEMNSCYRLDTLPKTDLNTIFDSVEVEASVDLAAWRTHLEKELAPVIENAANRKIKPGQYIVNIRFLVEKDGSISDVRALNDPGYGLGKGAERVVKRGPHWTPGIYKGKIVRSYHTQPIIFVIST